MRNAAVLLVTFIASSGCHNGRVARLEARVAELEHALAVQHRGDLRASTPPPTRGALPNGCSRVFDDSVPRNTAFPYVVNFDVAQDFSFYAGVDNALNQLPPYDLTGLEDGNAYSPVGRYFYAGARARF